jgi:hypothetical protein
MATVYKIPAFIIVKDDSQACYIVAKGEDAMEVARVKTLAAALRYIKKNLCVELMHIDERGGFHPGSKYVKLG